MEDNNLSNQASNQGPNVNQQFNNQFGQMPIPNSAGVLVLGILSIVGCFCYTLPGLIMGIIALVLAKKGNDIYKTNPNSYTISSYNNLKAGKVCAIIGKIISALSFLIFIVFVLIYGIAAFAMLKGGAFH
jgi:hypothetical protein